MTKTYITEPLHPDAFLTMGAELVFSCYSGHQYIKVLQSEVFGKMLVLDNHIQTTERDEHFYHEAMVQPIMFNDQPKRVLIVGGGDGGILKQVLKHDCVERAVVAELDPAVASVCGEYLPSVSGGAFSDPRAEMVFGDGLRYAQEHSNSFDLVILDLPDPEGDVGQLTSAEGLLTFQLALTDEGSLVIHTGSVIFQREQVLATLGRARNMFRSVIDYAQYVPTYGSLWGMAICRNARNAVQEDDVIWERFARKSDWQFKLYTPEYHAAMLNSFPTASWKGA